MKIPKRKRIIKDIYRGEITNFDSFFIKYIVIKKSLPERYKTEVSSSKEKATIKYFLVPDKRDFTEKAIKVFYETRKYLEENNYIASNDHKVNFTMRFVYWSWHTNSYTDFDPNFVYTSKYPIVRNAKYVVNKKKLRTYIKRGCRTKEELSQLIKKRAKFIISFIVVPVMVVLTFVFQFIWKPGFLTKERTVMNQEEMMDSKPDTLSKGDSSVSKLPIRIE